MTIGKLFRRDVVTVTRDDSIVQAARLMRRHHVGCVVVVEEKNARQVPAGLLTDRDIAVGVVGQGLDAAITKVGDVLAPGVSVIEANSTPIDAAALMRAKGVRRLPVVDGHGALIGLVAADDLIELVAEEMQGLSGLIWRGHGREGARRAGDARGHG